jgi:catechol 2,3-dioxygenase-like lactoylglutathione lyase family enzyme
MPVELNHIIVYAKDKRASARFLADVLGLRLEPDWGGFVPLKTGNGVTLDFAESDNVRQQHCAFLVSEAEFDAALERMRRVDIRFFAEFDGSGEGEVNYLYGGRGFYFRDPNGHLFELITRPYGPKPERWRDEKR